jgi:uncharacterized protein (TIGR00369 family)
MHAQDDGDVASQGSIVGFNQHLGIQVLAWQPGHCEMALPIEPRHLNRSGVVHGGVITTLIDAVASHAGNHAADPLARPRAVTVSLTTQFMGQGREGPLRAVGTRTGGGRRIFFARAEIYAPDGTLIATGDITGRVFPAP